MPAALRADPQSVLFYLGLFARFYVMVDDLAEFADLLRAAHREAADRDIARAVLRRAARRQLERAAARKSALRQLGDVRQRVDRGGPAARVRGEGAVGEAERAVAERAVHVKVEMYVRSHGNTSLRSVKIIRINRYTAPVYGGSSPVWNRGRGCGSGWRRYP